MTDLIMLILVLTISLIILYRLYEPNIVITTFKNKKLMILWYNHYIGGYPTGDRLYKVLFRF